jgi:hypothetical protein
MGDRVSAGYGLRDYPLPNRWASTVESFHQG